MQAALGQYTGRTAMYHVEELTDKQLQSLDPAAREDYELQMSYLRNMSCVEERIKFGMFEKQWLILEPLFFSIDFLEKLQ